MITIINAVKVSALTLVKNWKFVVSWTENCYYTTCWIFHITTAYTHLKGGQPFKSPIAHHACTTTWSIFVPVNSRLYIAVIVPDHKIPHDHPMLPIKVAFDVKSAYCKCINQTGVLAAMTKKVDNCTTSQPLFIYLNFKTEGYTMGYVGNNSIMSAARIKRVLWKINILLFLYFWLHGDKLKKNLIPELFVQNR